MKNTEQGVIDEQFTQLKQLEDDSNPDFVKEVLEMYVSDSKDRLRKMDEILYVATTHLAVWRTPRSTALKADRACVGVAFRLASDTICCCVTAVATTVAITERRTSRTTASWKAWSIR